MLKQLMGGAVLFGALAVSLPAAAADACAALQKFKLKDGAIDKVTAVAPPDTMDIGFKGLPPLPVTAAYCRVEATLKPTPASHVRIEVWLPPADSWNGKFLGAGNGGYAGSFTSPYLYMRGAVAQGYAVAGTDTGHAANAMGEPPSAAWALNQPELIKDYGYRANHVTAAAGKALVQAYYTKAPKRSYFQGCSDGGREALMEAQRFPEDYDGIIAGAPAYPWVRLVTGFAWNVLAVQRAPDAGLPPAKLSVLQDAVTRQCDKLDGVEDRQIEDPRQCKFDPASVLCPNGTDGEECLTAAQVETARRIYNGPKNPRTGAQIYTGFPPGGEAVQWTQWITSPSADQRAFATEFYRNMVFNKPDWELKQLDFDRDVEKANAGAGAWLNADNPDLSAFVKRGGKLISYHGWADAAIPPQSTIEYYEAVKAKLGTETTEGFMRLYMAPGMAHCLGGPGPSDFDALGALDEWVDQKKAPASLIAARYESDFAGLLGLPKGDPLRTRPLCPYPQVARYKGTGSIDRAENFSCRLP
ncbi:MAG: tannase/feruloyl esterase family alpha/beta hydrolase [Solimonas sp.]